MTQLAASETVGLFFSDVEGSTALALRLGDRFDDLLERHRALMRAAFAAYGGTEQSTEGDSFFVTFPTAAAAAHAAIDAQRALVAEAWTPGDEVRVRMGVHVGAVRQLGPTDLTGIDIHLAARVMSTGHGGQIVVTRGVVDQLLSTDIRARSLGEHQLKDIPGKTELFQVEATGLPSHFPPPRGVVRADSIRLPRVDKTFFGREDELKAGLDLLNAKRSLTLVGPPGAGKTRLALELAWQAQAGVARAAFVDLAAIDVGERVASSTATACGVSGGVDPVDGIVAFAGAEPTLLVLDNCEHVMDAASALVADLVARSSSITVLATSQVPLAHVGETLLPVGPLAGSSDDGQESAVLLFLDRAAALGIPISREDEAVVRSIVERLDHIPLAIELAASLTPTLSPGEIAERLDDRFRLLQDVEGTQTDRHRTLLEALDSSFERLGDDERRLVRRLAVCAGQFSLDAIEGLAADLGIPAVLPTVHRLVRASWLVREAAAARSRYRMLESLREFARHNAGEAAWEESQRAHARYFLGRHVALGLGSFPNDYAAYAEVDEEIANTLAAIDWACATGEELDAAAVAEARLTRYWQARPSWRDSRSMLERLLEAGTNGGMAVALQAEVAGGLLFYRWMVDGVLDEGLASRAQALAEESGDDRAKVRVAHITGQNAAMLGDYVEARRLAQVVIDGASRLPDGAHFAEMGFYRRGIARLQLEGLDAAEADFLRGLELSQEISDPFGLAFALEALADIEVGRGNREKAVLYAQRARAEAETCRHAVLLIVSANVLATLTLPPDELIGAIEALVDDARRLGSSPVECEMHLSAADAARRAGSVNAVMTHLTAFDALGGQTQAFTPHSTAIVRGEALAFLGRSEEAVAVIRGDLERARSQGAGACWHLAGTLARWGFAHPDPAVNRAIELSAVTAYRQFGDPRLPADAAAWRAEHPDLAAGTENPMPLDEVLAAILDDER